MFPIFFLQFPFSVLDFSATFFLLFGSVCTQKYKQFSKVEIGLESKLTNKYTHAHSYTHMIKKTTRKKNRIIQMHFSFVVVF